MTEAPPVTCGTPQPPSNGRVSFGNQSPPYAEGTTVTFQCDDGLFPIDTRTTTCEQSGLWEPNPGNLTCRERPGITFAKPLSFTL